MHQFTGGQEEQGSFQSVISKTNSVILFTGDYPADSEIATVQVQLHVLGQESQLL